MKLTVRLFDDDDDARTEWSDRLADVLGDAGNVAAIAPDAFREGVTTLEDRQRSARTNRSSAADCVFDDLDVLVVDYDLLELAAGRAGGGHETGERIAYLVRCYSTCRYVVALNQFTLARVFDTTLQGHVDSFADLNIGSESLFDMGLWFGRREEFRPWAWPRLLDEPARLDRLAATLADAMGDRVLTHLRLADSPLKNRLQRAHLEPLSRTDDPFELTFARFLSASPLARDPKDRSWREDHDPLVAAARLSKWVERVLLPAQDVVIDAPHLASFYPATLAGDPDGTADLTSEATDLPLDHEQLTDARWMPGWAARPLWAVPSLDPSDAGLLGAATAMEQRVFCEDISRFHDVTEAAAYYATFVSGPQERWVRRLENVTYSPPGWDL
ncbi:MAG: hypothetical protein KG028_13635 [Actinobacteria bacterium]|jgi:hypothetical protein|nr:hypothetical protein [Actinomycetota bacterium]